MGIINPKKSFETSQSDKWALKFRCSKITIIDIEYDHSQKKLEWNILSLFIGSLIFKKKEEDKKAPKK